ncbi:MAG: hypothetical protein EXQ96_00345 [Alphaproteobacteria bacterium]|nr:hypothetical protein [Alphaproteobacteria bacterium]
MSRFPVLLVALVVAAALATPAAGQRPAPAPETEAAAGSIEVEVNKGTLVRLSRAATAVFIADPKIADVQVKSPTLIYVFGRGAGETSLYAVDGEDRTLLNRSITVRHNLSRLRESLKSLLPHAAITVDSVELGFLPERRAALENLNRRTNMPEIRGVVNTLMQTERYGTPLAQSLRVLSAEFRNERMMRAEEKAARLPAILTVPMILFILPPLFIVLIGPAALKTVTALRQLGYMN